MEKTKTVDPLKTPLRIAHVSRKQAWIADADSHIVIICYAKDAKLIVNAVNAYASAVTSISVCKTEVK